jgi:hypothetical protein
MNLFKSSTAQEVQSAETRLPASLGRDSGPSFYQSQSKARGDIQKNLVITLQVAKKMDLN